MKEKLKEYLSILGFEGKEIDGILEQVDTEIDVKMLHEKIKFLIKIGLDKNIIGIIIDENLLFLTSDLETIEKNVKVLQKYLSKDEVINAIEITPELITLLQNTLQTNLNMLNIIIEDSKLVKEIIINNGEILLYNTNYLQKRFEFFIKNGLKEKIRSFIIENIELFDVEENEIDIEELKK